MSSTSGTKTAALSTTTPRRTGLIVGTAAGVLAIITFFLPWVVLVDNIKTLASLTGWQIASGALLASSEGDALFRGSPISYIVPIVGVIALVSALFAFRRGYVKPRDGLGTIAISIAAFFVIGVQFGAAGSLAEDGGILLQSQIGMFGVWLALLGLLVAGVLNTRAAVEQDPSFGSTLSAWGFMGPATFLVVVFFFLPALIMLYLSQTDLASANFTANPLEWNLIGLDNFKRLFNDAFFPKILANTFRYVVLTLGFFNVGLALLLALLTSHIDRRAGFFFRLLWLLPRITPSVIYIVMWKRMLQTPPYGIINWFINLFGGEFQPYWLTEHPWLFVVMVNGFVGASFGMILFTSAIESIPKDLFTAAKVDGASAWQIVRDITLPLLRWPLLFVTSYQTLSLLVSFEYILLLTEGGPGLFKTEVWSLTAYKRALFTYFGSHQWGYGAAWGFVLVVIGVILAIVYLRIFRFDELVQEPKIDVL